MTAVLFGFKCIDSMTEALCNKIDAEQGGFEFRRFPDEESYVRIDTRVEGRRVVICGTLDRPDEKFVPLHFLAAACRAEGAHSVGLMAPYLAYMRQDRQFHSGEAVGSREFARLISNSFDWLVTVDPHLHRIRALNELYSIPSRAVHAAPAVSDWIRANVERPVLIGPDEESEQWVSAVAADAGAPYVVLEKTRRGDRDVEVSVPEVSRWREFVPVLVDDIISTGRTMIATVEHLLEAGMKPPVCVGVHGIFAGDAYSSLRGAGAAQIATCNTIAHESNAIDVSPRMVEAVRSFL